jgi:hypothetical protein
MSKLFVLLRIADILTTYTLITHYGAYESNPLMDYLIKGGWGYYLIFQAISTAIILLIMKRYQIKLANLGVCALSLLVVVSNTLIILLS